MKTSDLEAMSALMEETATILRKLPEDVAERLQVRHFLADELDGCAIMLREPIPMVLHCPVCHKQHIDEARTCDAENCATGCALPGECLGWSNPPHRSHQCQSCGHVWRPADVATTGVQATRTRGKADS